MPSSEGFSPKLSHMTYSEIEKRMFDLKWELNSFGLTVLEYKEYKKLIKLRALHESNKRQAK